MLPPLFLSCAALSPLTLSREAPWEAASIEAVVPFWQPLEAGSPVEYFAGKTPEPRLEFRALRANLGDPRLRIVVGAGEKEALRETPGTVAATYVRSFVERFRCLGGINANPFDPVSAKEGESRLVAGIAVSEGRVLAQGWPDLTPSFSTGTAGPPSSPRGKSGIFLRLRTPPGASTGYCGRGSPSPPEGPATPGAPRASPPTAAPSTSSVSTAEGPAARGLPKPNWASS
jgi:hypothetical protein